MPEQLNFINTPIDYVLAVILVLCILIAVRNFFERIAIAASGRTPIGGGGPFFLGLVAALALWFLNR
jgi:hypothetical protein